MSRDLPETIELVAMDLLTLSKLLYQHCSAASDQERSRSEQQDIGFAIFQEVLSLARPMLCQRPFLQKCASVDRAHLTVSIADIIAGIDAGRPAMSSRRSLQISG